MSDTKKIHKIPVHLGNLSGPNGNAFFIMGQVKASARTLTNAGMPTNADHIIEEMMSGDYEHLLDTVLKYCDDLDGSIEDLRGETNWDEEEDEDDE